MLVKSQNGGKSCTGGPLKRENCNDHNCLGRDSQKEERLNDAAWEGDLATVRELIKTTFVDTTEGSPTRIIDGSSLGWTPLIRAAAYGTRILSKYYWKMEPTLTIKQIMETQP